MRLTGTTTNAETSQDDVRSPGDVEAEHTLSVDDGKVQSEKNDLPGGSPTEGVPSMPVCLPWVITVVGLGNTGTAAALLLARVKEVVEIRLIDPDRFEEGNTWGQSVPGRSSIGVAKAEALERAIHQIRPGLRVVSRVERVEDVAPGLAFGVRVVLSNLDGRASRRYTVETAWAMGVPVVDCGVSGGDRLLRVTVYVPGPERPCYICAVDPAAGGLSEQTYPCAGADSRGEDPQGAAATNAPAWLGATAAGLQLAEVEKILTGRPGHLLAGQELLLDVRFHKHYVSKLPYNPACPFHHRTLLVEPIPCTPGDLTIARAFAKSLPPDIPTGRNLPRFLRRMHMSLEVPAKQFVTLTQCGACGREASLLRLRHRLRAVDLRCSGCGRDGVMIVVQNGVADRLYPRTMGRGLSSSMFSVGFRAGDLFTILDPSGEARHFMFAVRHDPGTPDDSGGDPKEGGVPIAPDSAEAAPCDHGCPSARHEPGEGKNEE